MKEVRFDKKTKKKTLLFVRLEEEGIEIGILDGVRIGKQEGIKLGKTEGKAELIQMMLNTGNSVNDIAKVTGLSVDEIQKLI